MGRIDTREVDLLDQAQNEAALEADRLQLEGVDRRHFLFTSLVATAATTFGFGATALAQTPPATGGRAGGAGGGQAQATPPTPLGNGEPVSWTFQPYPYGTGALMEKTIRERGAAAFTRSVFTVDKWVGAVPTVAIACHVVPFHSCNPAPLSATTVWRCACHAMPYGCGNGVFVLSSDQAVPSNPQVCIVPRAMPTSTMRSRTGS